MSRAEFNSSALYDALPPGERVARLGADRDGLCRAHDEEAPGWLAELEGDFARPTTDEEAAEWAELCGPGEAPFMAALAPLTRRGRESLRAGIAELLDAQADAPFAAPEVERMLCAALPAVLVPLVNRTLMLELNVARVQGALDGADAGQSFESFFSRLRRPEHLLAIFLEYPVLARQLVRQVERWAAAGVEFLRHLCADREELRAAFDEGRDPGLLTALSFRNGDRHRGGRSVVVATFGSGLKLVYKPKSLAVERHFQSLLHWLNARGASPRFRLLNVLDRGEHGWVEFVGAEVCESAGEVRRFYARQGGYLALLYVMEATDFRCENLTACGEHPMLTDLEALFHPRPTSPAVMPTDAGVPEADSQSVLRVGLLPSLAGGGFDPADYVESLADGFESMYRLLRTHRRELLAGDGPLARFDGAEVRVVLRPACSYGTLLRESFRPNLLRDALDRDRCFDRLGAHVEQSPWLARVVAAERDDLLEGDIPFFTTRPDSRHLWTSRSGLVEDFFAESGRELVAHRLRHLSEADLARQLAFIRDSLSTPAAPGECAPSPGGRL